MYKYRFSANDNKMKIILLQLDSKLNQPDEKGCLTLDLALSTGQKDLALNLIEHKVQIDQLDSKGFTPLHNAIIRGIEIFLAQRDYFNLSLANVSLILL